MCGVCAGAGVALSGPCICGGTGTIDGECDGLRKALFAERRQHAEALAASMEEARRSAPEPGELGRDIECVRFALSLPLSGMNSLEEHKAASGARDAFERIIAALATPGGTEP
jgi:hypothetical protein